jgi:CDP-glucose 4,6-dehydratase
MKHLFNGIYNGTRVIVTGHTGFKGSWLAFWLTQLGAKVLGYSLSPNTSPNHFSMLSLNIENIIGDIRDINNLKNVFNNFKPEIIFHLAAQPLVLLSYKEPINTFETNIMGTVNVLETSRKIDSLRAIVNITSDKCYENKEWIWGYRENDAMGGYDPYSASKGCAELISNTYLNSFFNKSEYRKAHNVLLSTARAGNVIGGGDWANDRIIPDIIKAAHKNEKVIIRNPNATRPWQHVLDPLSGYLHIGQKLLEGENEFAGPWNFGPSDEGSLSVKEVVEIAIKNWNKIKYTIQEDRNKPYEANLLKLDCSKAHMKLKWHSVWSSSEAIFRTIEWYKNFYENNIILTKEHLNNYIEDAKNSGIQWA